jgi:hypothetical protein
MLSTILSWLTGGIIDSFTKPLVQAYEIKAKATNNHERLAADITIKQLEGDMQARQSAKEIRLATAGFWEMRALTFIIAFPFALHSALVGLDTVFDFSWEIAAYPKPFDEWEGTILLRFFAIQGGVTAIKALAWGIRR